MHRYLAVLADLSLVGRLTGFARKGNSSKPRFRHSYWCSFGGWSVHDARSLASIRTMTVGYHVFLPPQSLPSLPLQETGAAANEVSITLLSRPLHDDSSQSASQSTQARLNKALTPTEENPLPARQVPKDSTAGSLECSTNVAPRPNKRKASRIGTDESQSQSQDSAESSRRRSGRLSRNSRPYLRIYREMQLIHRPHLECFATPGRLRVIPVTQHHHVQPISTTFDSDRERIALQLAQMVYPTTALVIPRLLVGSRRTEAQGQSCGSTICQRHRLCDGCRRACSPSQEGGKGQRQGRHTMGWQLEGHCTT